MRGRAVAVTGGARGIGLATAQHLARLGARIAIGDLDADLAGAAAQELPEGSVGLPLDVADAGSFREFLARSQEAVGSLWGLVNNAGIMPLGAFLDQSDASAAATVAVNFQGVVNGMKLILPALLARGEGHIVNVASMGGRLALPGAAVYSASKFAVIGLTESLRGEIRGSGVALSLVLPTLVNTELGAGVPTGRGFHPVDPSQVAAGIAAAFASPTGRDLYVPAWMRAVDVASRLLPPPVMGAVRRVLDDERVISKLDLSARSGYEERIAEKGKSGRVSTRTSPHPA